MYYKNRNFYINRFKKSVDEQGFTLLEVVIAVAIFGIGIIALITLQISATTGNASARRVTNISTVAVDHMERLISLPYSHETFWQKFQF